MHTHSAQTFLDAAEEKFKINNNNNAEEAFNLATTAKQIDPHFPGIDNYLTAYGVHMAASKRNSRSVNWYAVLGLTGTYHDIDTVKKQYKKLSLMVHPDKNSSAAAEGAFKLISHAWKVISSPSWVEPSTVNNNNNDGNYTWRPSKWMRKGRKSETPNNHAPYCAKCGRWRSNYPSNYCLYCIQKEYYGSQSSSSSFSSNSTATGSCDRAEQQHTGFSEEEERKPIVKCLWCNSPCVYQSDAGYEAVKCTRCNFGHDVPAKQGWTPL